MKCPRDRKDLKMEFISDVEVDTCVECGGHWLDAGESAKLTGLSADMKQSLKITVDLLADPKPQEKLMCPRCETVDMVMFHFSQDRDLTVDRCPRCNGIWLDTDELSRAIEIARH